MPQKKRNVLVIKVNAKNELLANDQAISIAQLRPLAKEFILNPSNNPNFSEKKEKSVPLFGNMLVSKQNISIQTHSKTAYRTFIAIQNELAAAYHELRNELAEKHFNQSYDDLLEAKAAERVAAIRAVYPYRISELDPYTMPSN